MRAQACDSPALIAVTVKPPSAETSVGVGRGLLLPSPS